MVIRLSINWTHTYKKECTLFKGYLLKIDNHQDAELLQ